MSIGHQLPAVGSRAGSIRLCGVCVPGGPIPASTGVCIAARAHQGPTCRSTIHPRTRRTRTRVRAHTPTPTHHTNVQRSLTDTQAHRRARSHTRTGAGGHRMMCRVRACATIGLGPESSTRPSRTVISRSLLSAKTSSHILPLLLTQTRCCQRLFAFPHARHGLVPSPDS